MSNDPKDFEPHPDPQSLTSPVAGEPKLDTDYEPHPEKSLKIDAGRQKVIQSICNLYSGSASEEDMQVYAEKAVYDDPWSYCDTRYKIAGQWYGEKYLSDPLYLQSKRVKAFLNAWHRPRR